MLASIKIVCRKLFESQRKMELCWEGEIIDSYKFNSLFKKLDNTLMPSPRLKIKNKNKIFKFP